MAEERKADQSSAESVARAIDKSIAGLLRVAIDIFTTFRLVLLEPTKSGRAIARGEPVGNEVSPQTYLIVASFLFSLILFIWKPLVFWRWNKLEPHSATQIKFGLPEVLVTAFPVYLAVYFSGWLFERLLLPGRAGHADGGERSLFLTSASPEPSTIAVGPESAAAPAGNRPSDSPVIRAACYATGTQFLAMFALFAVNAEVLSWLGPDARPESEVGFAAAGLTGVARVAVFLCVLFMSYRLYDAALPSVISFPKFRSARAYYLALMLPGYFLLKVVFSRLYDAAAVFRGGGRETLLNCLDALYLLGALSIIAIGLAHLSGDCAAPGGHYNRRRLVRPLGILFLSFVAFTFADQVLVVCHEALAPSETKTAHPPITTPEKGNWTIETDQ